jgi:microcystin-dependent protein
MGQPYIGEIRMFGGSFAPTGWAFCNGQLLPISENDTLFNLIGTTYGGDGQSTFAMPDLRGRVPIHQGSGFILAESGGVEEVTLTVNQIPVHSHAWIASEGAATSLTPAGNMPAEASKRFYVVPSSVTPMAAQSVIPAGGSQPHTNFQPYLCISFIISLFGIFPPSS